MSKLGRQLNGKVTFGDPANRHRERIIEVAATFACEHVEPIKVHMDAAAPPEEVTAVRARMEAAKGRAKFMPCLLCAHKRTSMEWTRVLNGEEPKLGYIAEPQWAPGTPVTATIDLDEALRAAVKAERPHEGEKWSKSDYVERVMVRMARCADPTRIDELIDVEMNQ